MSEINFVSFRCFECGVTYTYDDMGDPLTGTCKRCNDEFCPDCYDDHQEKLAWEDLITQ